MTAAERVVVTGMAGLAANGSDTPAFWAATLAGRSGLGRLTRFDGSGYPVTVVAEVPDFSAPDHVIGRLMVQTDLWTQFALTTSDRALADAEIELTDIPEHSMAVITASSSGGNEFGQIEIERLWHKGPQHVGPYPSIAWFSAATTGQLSIKHGMKGPCGVIVAEQAGGLDAIGHARRAIRKGATMALTGGTEAPIGPYALTCQLAAGILDPQDDPDQAYLAFDPRAQGHVPGEGGAILVIEEESAARRRSAPQIYGEIAGYAATYGTGDRSGPVLRAAIEQALADAEVTPADVDVVFADAAGVPAADQVEIDILAEVFGPRGVPVTAPKTLIGRVYAGGPALDVVCALLAIRDQVVPPMRVLDPTLDLPLDLVTETRPATVRTALILARGYGGFTSALVVRAVPEHAKS
jgi:minimal PKS chain-length factor (CLF/KS beta)